MSEARFLVLTSASGVSDADLEACAVSGSWRRLGPTGAEVGVEDPAALTAARAALASRAVDANLVAARGREKRLLICDMDSTVITVECIDEIADFAGVKPQVAEITERAMRGEVDFEGALIARAQLLAGLPLEALEAVWRERVRLSAGAETLARTMAARGAETALVSGGFTYFTERVAAAAGFASHQANTLLAEGGRLTGAVGAPILGQAAKLEALARLTAARGLTVAEAVAVGDGANDLAMLRAAGLGVAYRAKPLVASEADARLAHSDLTAVLHLQGIAADAFVL